MAKVERQLLNSEAALPPIPGRSAAESYGNHSSNDVLAANVAKSVVYGSGLVTPEFLAYRTSEGIHPDDAALFRRRVDGHITDILYNNPTIEVDKEALEAGLDEFLPRLNVSPDARKGAFLSPEDCPDDRDKWFFYPDGTVVQSHYRNCAEDPKIPYGEKWVGCLTKQEFENHLRLKSLLVKEITVGGDVLVLPIALEQFLPRGIEIQLPNPVEKDPDKHRVFRVAGDEEHVIEYQSFVLSRISGQVETQYIDSERFKKRISDGKTNPAYDIVCIGEQYDWLIDDNGDRYDTCDEYRYESVAGKKFFDDFILPKQPQDFVDKFNATMALTKQQLEHREGIINVFRNVLDTNNITSDTLNVPLPEILGAVGLAFDYDDRGHKTGNVVLVFDNGRLIDTSTLSTENLEYIKNQITYKQKLGIVLPEAGKAKDAEKTVKRTGPKI